MIQLQKYTWLIDTIRRAGKISLEEISNRWERNKDLSDYKPLNRATFNRWIRRTRPTSSGSFISICPVIFQI